MLENTNKQKESNMRSYPIWVDTYNPSYKSSMAKSQGIRDYASSEIYVGTSASNSYKFGNFSIKCDDDKNERKFHFLFDDELMKSATYNKNKKRMEVESLEPSLKAKYFDKWKAEEEAEAQKFRNERYAERLAVNGQ